MESIGPLQDAAVLAADTLLSPVSPDILSAREFLDVTQKLRDRVETTSAFGLSIPPMQAMIYRQENTRDLREIAQAIRDEYRKLKCRAIPRRVRLCIVPCPSRTQIRTASRPSRP